MYSLQLLEVLFGNLVWCSLSAKENTRPSAQIQYDITYNFGCSQVTSSLHTLRSCLTSMYGRPIMSDELRQVGLMVERITRVTLMFRHLGLKMEEYVCLKVIIMLNPSE